MITRRQFTGGLALISPALCSAETLQERGRRVIDRCIEALGGDAWRQMPGHVQTGRAYQFYEDEISGLDTAKIYTKYFDTPQGDAAAKKALLQLQRQIFGKKDDETVLLGPAEGWDITYRGAEAVPADRIDQYRESVLTDILYILRARMKEADMTLFARGADVVENQPTEVVDYYDSENRNVKVWIHSSTWLPVRQLVKRWDPMIKDRRDIITRYTKYRDIGNGVMWPYDIQRERDGQKTYQLYADSVKVGMFDEKLFALPPGVKIIKKK